MVWVLFAFGVSWLGSQVGAWVGLRAYRKHRSGTWVERAQCAWGPRRFLINQALFCPSIVIIIGVAFQLSLGWIVAAGIAAFLGNALVRWRVDMELLEQTTPFWKWLGLGVATLSILSLGGALQALLIGLLMPPEFNGLSFALIGLSLAFWTASACGGTVFLWKALGLITPLPEAALNVVQAASAGSNIPFKGAYTLKLNTANACALPIDKHLLFSNRLLQVCDSDELSAIASHELTHLNMPAKTLFGLVFLYVPLLLTLLCFKPLLFQYGWETLFGALFGAFLLFTIGSKWLMQAEEKRADRGAVANEKNEGVYAKALEKLHEANLLPVDLPSSRGHSSLYDRLTDAGAPPTYERPGRPPLLPTLLAFTSAWATIAFVSLLTLLVITQFFI